VFEKLLSFIDYIIPGTNNIKQELLRMRPYIKDLRAQLVDYSSNEIDIFSLVQAERNFSKRFEKQVKAHFNSIYHEPLIAYFYKELRFSKYAALYASTVQNEFFYIIGPEWTTIYVDTHLLGMFSKEGLLYAKRKGRLVARVNNLDRSSMPVIVGDREVASIQNVLETDKYNPRMFEYVNVNTKAEELTLIALAIFLTVDKTKDLKKVKA
jgi:hypothetical protein